MARARRSDIPHYVVRVGLALAVGLGVSCTSLGEARYALALDVDYAAGSYAGRLTVAYTNRTDDALAELFFRLFPNASELYGLASLDVLDVQTATVPLETALYVDDTVLMVLLPEPLSPGQSTSVTLSFRGQASIRLDPTADGTGEYGILTKAPDTLTLTSFYPIVAPYLAEGWALDPVSGLGDAMFAEVSTYDVTVRVEAGPTPVASGRLVDVVPEDGRVTYRFVADSARDFSLVLAGDGRLPQTAATRDLAIRAWFRPEHAEAAAAALRRAVAAIELYTDLIGPLPFDEVEVVEVPLDRVAGVEWTGLVLVSEQYSADPADVFFDILVSHELAHEWFYAAVGNDPVESPWLDEGLATLLSNVFLARAVSPATATAEQARWQRTYRLAQSRYPGVAARDPLYDFPDETSYSAFAYSGAAAEFDAIRSRIGDDAFFAALSAYYRSSLLSIAVPIDLQRAFEAACGCVIGGALFPSGATP